MHLFSISIFIFDFISLYGGKVTQKTYSNRTKCIYKYACFYRKLHWELFHHQTIRLRKTKIFMSWVYIRCNF